MAAGNEARSRTAASVIWSLFKRSWCDEAVRKSSPHIRTGSAPATPGRARACAKDVLRNRGKWDKRPRPPQEEPASGRESARSTGSRRCRGKIEKTRKQSAKEMGFRVSVLDDMVAQARAAATRSKADDEIERINADHALVLAGNKAGVMKFEGADQVPAVADRRLQAVVRQSDWSRSARRSFRSAITGWATRSGGNMRASSSRRRDGAAARLLQSLAGICGPAQARATARSSWRT